MLSDLLREFAESVGWLILALCFLIIAAVFIYILVTIIITGGMALWKAIRTGEYTTLEEVDRDNKWKP